MFRDSDPHQLLQLNCMKQPAKMEKRNYQQSPQPYSV